MEILLVISLDVASFAFHVQPAVTQGGNPTLPIAYSGQVLRGDGSQTCHSEEQREISRNQVDNATLSLLQESVVPSFWLLHSLRQNIHVVDLAGDVWRT